jgi:hypothetical protein
MSAEDYAVVVGIASYPQLGDDRTPLNLKGPENDADSIVRWLRDPKGGAIPETDSDGTKHIYVIKSSDFPSGGQPTKPTGTELEAAMRSLEEIARRNLAAGKGERVGRRLYIYMSGHGFSPARRRGCLFAADADDRFGTNVHVTAWLDWFQDGGYFREYVLWLDCCMNRVSLLPPREPPARPRASPMPPGATFVAFAAQRPLKAVEVPIAEDQGRSHGVFTWALLEGLRGAAADANGRVTGRSLADWIRNAQAGRLTPGDRGDVEVSKEPEVIQEDAGLIFARGVSVKSYPVQVVFENGVLPQSARLWSGLPLRQDRTLTVQAGRSDLALAPGLYLVEDTAAGLRHGFEVVGPTEVTVTEHGPPIAAAPGQVFELDIDPGDPAAEIFVVDAEFSLADAGSGRLSTPLPFGLYKIKTRSARQVKERVICLDGDRPPLLPRDITPPIATAALVDGTMATHEYQMDAARSATQAARRLALEQNARGAISVMARVWSGPEGILRDTRPWEGVTVVDARGRTVIDLTRDGRIVTEGDPFAVATVAVDPGVYYLRHELTGHGIVEQTLIVADRWGVEVSVLRRAARDHVHLDVRRRVSVQMRDLDGRYDAERDDRLVETARIALADERRILNAALERRLLRELKDPMAGLIGAHLLLIEQERNPTRDMSVLNEVVPHLRTLLGPDHPDVEALSWRCPDERLRRLKPITAPPIFQRSWALLTAASADHPRLVPEAIGNRVLARTPLSLYLVWTINEEIRTKARSQLAGTTWERHPDVDVVPGGRSTRSGGRRLRARVREMEVGGFGQREDAVVVSANEGAPPSTSARRLADRQVARARAIKLQIPVSVLGILRREWMTREGGTATPISSTPLRPDQTSAMPTRAVE